MYDVAVYKRLLLFISLIFCSVSVLAQWPDVKVPPNSQLTVVSDGMNVNGADVMAYEVSSSLPLSKFIAYYKTIWSKPVTSGGVGYQEVKADGWNIISRLDDGYLITVQVKASGRRGSTALIAVSNLPKLKTLPVLGEGFPSLSNTLFVNDIYANDPQGKSRTLMFENSKSVTVNLKYYQGYYQSRGWKQITRRNNGNHWAVQFQKSNSEVNLTLSQEKKKTVMLAVAIEYL